MMRRGGGASEESRRAAATGAGEGKGNDDLENGASNVPRPCSRSQGDGNVHYDVNQGNDFDDDNDDDEAAMVTTCQRPCSRGPITTIRSRKPSPALPTPSPMRSPRLTPRQLSPSPRLQHGLVEVTRDIPTHPYYTHPTHPPYLKTSFRNALHRSSYPHKLSNHLINPPYQY